MVTGYSRHGNRVMEDMVQGNKRHGNRVFKTWYRVIRDTVTGYSRHGDRVIRGSSEIWSDKLKVGVMDIW